MRTDKYFITKGGTGVRQSGSWYYYDKHNKWDMECSNHSTLGISPLDIDREISEIEYRNMATTDTWHSMEQPIEDICPAMALYDHLYPTLPKYNLGSNGDQK